MLHKANMMCPFHAAGMFCSELPTHALIHSCSSLVLIFLWRISIVPATYLAAGTYLLAESVTELGHPFFQCSGPKATSTRPLPLQPAADTACLPGGAPFYLIGSSASHSEARRHSIRFSLTIPMVTTSGTWQSQIRL